MKVTNSIRSCHRQQCIRAEELAKRVRELLVRYKEKRWYYDERIKELESFALKIETGKIDNPDNANDFFGCTIVVRHGGEIESAKELVKKLFDVVSQDPTENRLTEKHPHSFPFDDLRLHAKLKHDSRQARDSTHNRLAKVLFEIQIKTFLQHAWSKATHNLVYKSDEISWPKSRVAYQVKAMLEHAELSIHEIDKLKESILLNKIDENTVRLTKIKKFLTDNWPPVAWPTDLVRLSGNVDSLLRLLNTDVEHVQSLLDIESDCGRGINTLNLPPYFTILQTLINQKPALIRNFFADALSDEKIVIPHEIDTRDIILNETKIIRV